MFKIGIAGGRGLSTLKGLKAIPDVTVAAVCDISENNLEDIAKSCEDLGFTPAKYRIFDDMIESDIDAVIIATPMQCHVPQAIAAMEAGKHVMSEVTAGVTMDELFWLCETVEKYNKIYMYAENYIYTPQVQLVKNMVAKGLFGETYYAEGMYLHELSNLLKYKDGKTSWRSYWQLGKRGNFYPTHSLGPVMQWFPGEHITEISTFSPGIWNDSGVKQDSGTTTMCRTGSGKLIEIRTDCLSPRPHNMDYYQLQGTKGAFQSPTYGKGDKMPQGDIARVAFIPEEGVSHIQWEELSNYNHFMPERYAKADENALHSGHGGGDFFIVEDFINAVRSGVQPDLDVYTACEWTAVGLLSAISVANNGMRIEIPRFRPDMPIEEKIIKL